MIWPFIDDVVLAVVGDAAAVCPRDVIATDQQGTLVAAVGSDPLSCFPVSVREVPAIMANSSRVLVPHRDGQWGGIIGSIL